METRQVLNIDLLGIGHYVAATGPVDFTLEQLQAAVQYFADGIYSIPAVKVGHSSDAFNLQLAEKLGVDVDLLTGENGNGALGLGTIAAARLENERLFVDLEGVPEPIAALIEQPGSGFLTVSAEIDGWQLADGRQVYPVITGIALLGAEDPAVDDQAGLEAATVLQKAIRQARALLARLTGRRAQLHTAQERADQLRWVAMDVGLAEDASVDDIISWLNQIKAELPPDTETAMQEGEEMDPQILEALGLGPEATLEEVIAAIMQLKEQGAGTPPAPPQMTGEPTLKSMNEIIAGLTQEMDQLKQERDLSRFERLARESWPHITHDPKDTAKDLHQIQLAAGKEAVDRIIQDRNEAAAKFIASGAITRLSSPRDGAASQVAGADTEFMREAKKWAEEHEVEAGEGVKHLMKAKPDLYRAHVQATTSS